MKKLFFVLLAVTIGFAACKKAQNVAPASQASFSTNIVTGHTPTEFDAIQLTNTSTPNSKYLWDFGNGTTSTEANPTTLYQMHGYYTIKLSVTDSKGVTTTTSKDVSILCRFKNNDHTTAVLAN